MGAEKEWPFCVELMCGAEGGVELRGTRYDPIVSYHKYYIEIRLVITIGGFANQLRLVGAEGLKF